MAAHLPTTESQTTFFQNVVERMLTYWRDHDAVQNVDVAVLDRERHRILKNIALGLDLQPLWPLVKTLVIAFAPYMERRGFWDAWHGILEQAIRMAQRAKDVDAETTLTSFLARLCQRMSRPQDVVRHYRRVIKLARQTNNRFEEARACSNLGYLYIDGGRWWRSEVLSRHALEIFEELGSEHGRAHTHNHLGLLYTREDRWQEAISNLENALQIWQVLEDEYSLIHVYINLGTLYIELADPDNALKNLKKSLQVANSVGETSNIGLIWNNIAFANRLSMDWQEAEQFAKKAEISFRKHSNRHQLANVWHNLALIMLGKGDNLSASEYFRASLSMHQKLRNQIGINIVQDDMKAAALSKDYKTTA